MKKLLILFAVVFSFSADAQVKDSLPEPADTVKVLSKRDLGLFIKELRDRASVTYYESMKPTQVIDELYYWFLNIYFTKKPEEKKK